MRRVIPGQSHARPSTALDLAMPRGAVSGFAEAVDFAESIGLAHHPEYYNATSDVTTGISRAAELGIKHFRLGLWTPASQVNMAFKTGPFGLAMNGAGMFALWGSAEEPQYRAGINGEVAKYGGVNDTFYRMLSGPAGSTTTTFWPGTSSYYPGELKWGNSAYYQIGWETAGGFQGPNEPVNFRNPPGTWYEGSIRNEVMRPMMNETKVAQATREVMGGHGWINHTTGRFETGPVYANQLPVVAPPMGTNSDAAFTRLGDYTNGDADVGSVNIYWGGHEPNFPEAWSTASNQSPSGVVGIRYKQASYNGALSSAGRFNRELPYMVTETGYNMTNASGRTDYCPPWIAAEYLIRTVLHNYYSGLCVRTFVFEFNNPPYGICAPDWTRKEPFHGLKNLLTLVGRGQGTGTPPPLTITGFTPGPANNQPSDGYSTTSKDRLQALTLRRGDKDYLRIVTRDRSLWDRTPQAERTVADPQTLTMTVPAGSTVTRSVPALNPIHSPNDGLDYSWAGNDGTATQTMTVSGGNTVSWDQAGLTQVFRVQLP